MRLYLLRGDLDFHWLRPVGEAAWPWRGGVPVALPWREPSLTISEDNGAEAFLPVDCLPMNTGSDGPILSDYARSELDSILGPAGEFWPVQVLGHRYWWFNCLSCIDALDPERTDAEWDEIEGEWGSFRWISSPRTLEFRPDVVASAPAIFRVPEFPQGVLFGGEALSQAISEFGLTGFQLDPVWSSNEGGVKDPRGFNFGEAFTAAAPGEAAHKRARARAALEQRSAGANDQG